MEKRSKFSWVKWTIVLLMVVVFSYQPPIKGYSGDTASTATVIPSRDSEQHQQILSTKVKDLFDSATSLSRDIGKNITELQTTSESVAYQAEVIKTQSETIDSILSNSKIRRKK